MIRLNAFVTVLWVLMAAGLQGQRDAFAVEPSESELRVDINFPGGSAEVESIDQEQRLIRIRPTDHANRGWRCWWYFKVVGVEPGETIAVDVGDAPWATPLRAHFSTDGEKWLHTSPGKQQGKRIVYHQQVNAKEAWFAWGPPFVPGDAEKLVQWAADQSPHGHAFELCKTREGRSVPALRIEAPGADNADRYGIWIQARQHAWESGSSWVCRGLVEWLVSDDPRAEALLKQARITIVPIMDIDNVAIGAGGKSQLPQDHNRDWSDAPHWPSVAAAMKEIQQQHRSGSFDLFIDLHNPDANAKNPFFYIPPRKVLSAAGTRNLDRLLADAQQEMTGPLAFRGETRESGSDYDKKWRQISKNWVSFNTGDHVVAVTLETAWNTPDSTTDGYRSVGKQLAQAIARYFRTSPRSEPAK